MKKYIDICFIKFGNVVFEYEKVKDIWRDNGAKLIWDINEVSKKHKALAISSNNNLDKSPSPCSYSKEPQLELYSINFTFPKSIKAKISKKIQYQLKLFTILKKYRIKNIACSNFQFLALLLLYCKLNQIKFIPYFTADEQFTNLNLNLLRLFNVEDIIVCGKHMKENLVDHKVGDKIIVRIPKYPAAFFNDKPFLNIPKYPFTVIFVARVEKAKGLYEFIEAAFKILEKNHNIGFLILGDGSEYGNAKNMIEKSGYQNNIKLLGLVDQQEVGTYLRKSDVLVFPSYREGFAKTWLEAVYTETPIITTALPAVHGFLTHKETAVFIDKENVDDIVNSILLLFNDKELRTKIKRNLKKLKKELLEGNEFLSLKDAVLKTISC